MIVDHIKLGKVGKYSLEIRADLEAIEGPFKIRRGHRVATMELDALAQVKAYRGRVKSLVAGRQAIFKREVLGPANQRIERHMRQLQHAAR